MKRLKQKVWIGIGAFVLTGTHLDFSAKGTPSVDYGSSLAASPKEGGEGGEGGEAGRRAGKAQSTVDDAEMRYVIVHLHKLLQPDLPKRRRKAAA